MDWRRKCFACFGSDMSELRFFYLISLDANVAISGWKWNVGGKYFFV